jgi:hypothetical protein
MCRAAYSLFDAEEYLLTYTVVILNGEKGGAIVRRPQTVYSETVCFFCRSPALQGLVIILLYGLDQRLLIVQLFVRCRQRVYDRLMTEEEKESGISELPYDDCFTGEIAEARGSRIRSSMLGTEEEESERWWQIRRSSAGAPGVAITELAGGLVRAEPAVPQA